VNDLAKALTVMASIGYDPTDNITALVPPSSRNVDYSAELYGSSLKGIRLGLLLGFFNSTASNETTPVNNVMDAMASKLTTAGATIVPINSTIYNATAISATLDVQTSEYRPALDAYLSMPSLGGVHPSNFSQLYHSGKFLVIPSQYDYVNTAFRSSPANASYLIAKLGIQNLTTALRDTFTANNLDAIIYPEQKNLVVKLGSPSQSGRNGILAALTGSPVVTVPAGFSNVTEDAPIGVPIGMEILGRPWEEGKLLNIAARIEALTHLRRLPAFANGTVEVGVYSSVPSVVPDTANIPSAYPVGVLS
jgi:Asp-tRNA(Asn)/Glu-tRNA(Gln) amidotransferase A subunit family amidase